MTTEVEDRRVADVAARSVAMLIVRAWREEGSFRATVTSSPDVATIKLTDHGATATPNDVLELVDGWLSSI